MRRDWDKLPDEIKEHGLDFHWDNEKVWNLSVPVEEMDITELEWMLDMPFWHNKDEEEIRYTICPSEVIKEIDRYPFHKERMMKARVEYPIDLMQNKYDRWVILDGMHRLINLIQQRETKVLVRKISRELIPLIEK
jgi:hypothetical protein